MKFPYLTALSITSDLTGFYRIDNDSYHAGPGVSSSTVKKALKGYQAYRSAGVDKASLKKGRAFHTLMLEPHLFSKQFAVMPKFDGHPSSKKYQEAKAQWLLSNSGRDVITADEAESLAQMSIAVRSHPEFQNFSLYDVEIMAITHCQETGLQIKCKSDLFSSAIVDLKSTSSGVSTSEFMNDIVRWGYHISGAFYQDIIRQLTGEKLPFILIPVTSKAPFECEVYTLSDELLEEGRKLYRAGLRRIKRWNEMTPNAILSTEKKMRVLYPTPRVLYSTIETLEFLGDA